MNYFPMVKVVDWVHAPVDHERRWPTVDHGHRPGGGSPEIGRNAVPVRGTSPRLRKNGEGMEVSLTGGTGGRRRVGHNGVMVGTIGGGDAWWRGSCGLENTRLRAR
jgi:hypothetical protein